MDDSFSVDEILIVVKPEYNFNVYNTANFSEYGCTGINEIFTTISHGETCRIFKLDLSCKSKQDVLSVIKQLEKREDIYCDYNPDGEAPKTADPVMLAVPAFILLASTIASAWLFRRKRSI